MTYDDLNFCNKLRTIHELRNISMDQMAERLNISRRMYHRIEREESNVNLKRFIEICNALDLSYMQFLLFNRKEFFQIPQNEIIKSLNDKIREKDELLKNKDAIIKDKNLIIEQLRKKIMDDNKEVSPTSP